MRIAVNGWGRLAVYGEVNGLAAPAAYLNGAIERTRPSVGR